MTKLSNECKCRGVKFEWSVHCITDHRYQKGHPWVSAVLRRGKSREELNIAWSGYNCKVLEVKYHPDLPLVEIRLKPDKKPIQQVYDESPYPDEKLAADYERYQDIRESQDTHEDLDERFRKCSFYKIHFNVLSETLQKACYPNENRRKWLDDTFPMRVHQRWMRGRFPDIDLYSE